MRLTPLDIQHQTFRKVTRGLDQKQVQEFLELVRIEWENVLREHQAQREEIEGLERRLHEFEEKERTLHDTLLTAQRMSDDMKQSATKEAEIVVGQAELQAEKIIHQAHGRLTEILDEINELKRQRATFEGKLRGMIESHMRLIDLQKDAREVSQLEDVSILPRAT